MNNTIELAREVIKSASVCVLLDKDSPERIKLEQVATANWNKLLASFGSGHRAKAAAIQAVCNC